MFMPSNQYKRVVTGDRPKCRDHSRVLGERPLDCDLLRSACIDYSADELSDGPGIQIEDSREVVFFAKVVDDDVRVDVGWQFRHELAHGGEIAQKKAVWRFWLGNCVSMRNLS